MTGRMHAWQSTSGTPHKGSKPQCNGFGAPIVLINPTRSKRPASYFPTRAKLPQHEFNGCVILFGVWSPSALDSPNNALHASTLITALPKYQANTFFLLKCATSSV